jgi:hypothetical protein
MKLAAAILVALAVRGTSVAAPVEGDAGGMRARRPACKVELEPFDEHASPPREVRVRVHGHEVSLGKPESSVKELAVHPAGPHDVLVAYGGRDENGPRGASTLWQISCADGRAEIAAHVPNADFSHSALSPDGKSLLYTGPDGIFTFDIKTRQTRRVTQAPALAKCDLNDQPRAQDVVGRFVDRNTLAFERGGPCGFEAEWDATDMLLRNPMTSHPTVEKAPRPPFPSVAIDASGGFWLADGLCGDQSTYDRVLFSADHGDHWRKVRVKTRDEQPLVQVITDRKDPGVLLVLSQACQSGAHTDPAWIYVTRDAGKTFRPIAVPPGIPRYAEGGPDYEQNPVQAITAPDGDLAHLLLYGRSQDFGGALIGRWESRDGGQSWKALGPVNAPPEPPPPTAARGEWALTIRKDGLYRSRNGGAAVRIYPKQ